MRNYFQPAILTILLLATISSAFAKTLKITAVITGIKDSTEVILLPDGSTEGIASAYLIDNKFSIEADVKDNPASYVLYFNIPGDIKYTYLFCKAEDILIRGDINDFPNALKVTGSEYNVPNMELNFLTQVFEKRKETLQKEILELYNKGQFTETVRKEYFGDGSKMEQLENEKHKTEKEYIANHLDKLYCIYLLDLYKPNYYTFEELYALYKKIPPDLKKTVYGQAIKYYLKSPKLQNGNKYYDFKSLGLNGELKFSKFFTGKNVLLVFGSPGCSASMASMPMQQNIYKNMSDKLTLIMYYDGTDESVFKEFSDTKKYPWTFMWNKEGRFNKAYNIYHVGSTPTFFLFDAKGKLIETWSGYNKSTEKKIVDLIR